MNNAHRIALSAVSAAFAIILLTLGAYIEILDISCVMLAGIAIMLPLSKKDVLGGFLAYLAAGLLALPVTGFRFAVIVPYAVFFGLYPIVNAIIEKYLPNKKILNILFIVLKDIWFLLSMYVYYRVLVAFTGYDFAADFAFVPEQFRQYIVPALIVFGAVFFVLYDYVMKKMQRVIEILVSRVIKK